MLSHFIVRLHVERALPLLARDIRLSHSIAGHVGKALLCVLARDIMLSHSIVRLHVERALPLLARDIRLSHSIVRHVGRAFPLCTG